MTTPVVNAGPPVKKPRARRGVKSLSQQARLEQFTPEARRTAACVLEVLAGVRTPEQAAKALGLSLPTYYQTETRALRGLVSGCTPEPPGRSMVLAKQLRSAQLRVAVLEKQVQRYQALLRTTQRSVGLMPADGVPKPGGKDAATGPARGGRGDRGGRGGRGGRRPKRPSVRALRAVGALRDGQGVDRPDASNGVVDAPVMHAHGEVAVG